MTQQYSEEEVIALVADLTRPRLVFFIQARLVVPQRTSANIVFRQIDIARLELLCDLTDQYGMEEDVLSLILSLIDQLHGARSDLRRVMQAIASEPQDVRARLGEAVVRARALGDETG